MLHAIVALSLTAHAGLLGGGDKMPAPEPPVVQQDRVEIGVSSKDRWTVEPVGDQGLILLGTDSRGAAWTLVRYDTDFAQQWVTTWESPDRRARLIDSTTTEDALWLLLHRPKRATFTLLEVPLASGEVVAHTVSAPGRPRLTHELEVVEDDAYVLVSQKGIDLISGIEGQLVHVDTASNAVQPVDLSGTVGSRRASYQRLTVDAAAGTLEVSATSTKRKRRSLHAVTVKDGRVTDHRTLAPPEDGTHNLLTGQRVRTDTADLVLGTYSAGQKTLDTQGLYVARLAEDGTEQWRHTTSFADLDRFFDYLPERRQKRLKKKKARKEERGGDLRLSYLLNLHDVVEQDGRLLVIGEAFYPEYQTITRTETYTDANGNVQTRVVTYQVFVGYRYTHAVVVAFDDQGKRVWDASFEIGNILSYSIRDRVQVSVEDDRVTMVYSYGGRIYSKIATSAGIEEEKATDRVVASGGGKVKKSWATHTEHWFDDQFLVYGYQKVKGGEGGKRKVFAFSRVSESESADTGE